MTEKSKKWFRSAFLNDSSGESPIPKKARECSTIDLTQDDFEEKLPAVWNTSKQSIECKKSQVSNTGTCNWIELFEPRIIADLAIHPKKIAEVQDWMRHYETTKKKYPGQMLLITGPAGAGKTATVKVLAKEMNYDLIEWITPVDVDLMTGVQINGSDTFRESQAEVFKQFLLKTSRYKSLFDVPNRRLILVEDFPNVFIRDADGFTELLQNYRTYGKSPLIFIVTDSKSKQLNLAFNLFPECIRAEHHINNISFNPVSATFMKKALNRICGLMQNADLIQIYKVPAANIIESINISSQGDLRNAVINLHFASLKGAPTLESISLPKSIPNKANKKLKGKTLKSVGKDESITLMHALGRVFNPKYEENLKIVKFLHIPEELADAFSPEPRMFVDFLHSNYTAHFNYIENAFAAADHLSLSDFLLSEYREDSVRHMGLNIAVRGVMVSNKHPVSGWLPVKGLKRVENQRTKLEAELRTAGVKNELSSNVLVSDYRTYVRIIKDEKNS